LVIGKDVELLFLRVRGCNDVVAYFLKKNQHDSIGENEQDDGVEREYYDDFFPEGKLDEPNLKSLETALSNRLFLALCHIINCYNEAGIDENSST